jgi:hypothetical protein
MENIETTLNHENFKTLLTNKLFNLLNERTEHLESKINNDLEFIEKMKYDFYDNYKKCKIKNIKKFK